MAWKLDEASEHLRRACEMAPESALFRFFYARVLAALGRVEEACELISRIERDTPEEMFARFGPIYRNALLGHVEEALTYLTPDVEATMRKDETVSWFMGEALALLGQRERAIAWLAHAAEIGFSNYPLLAYEDDFLANVRGEPEFKALLTRVKEIETQVSVPPENLQTTTGAGLHFSLSR